MGFHQSGWASVNVRTAKRFETRWRARLVERKSGTADGQLVDISATGLRFLSSQRFRTGERAEMDIIVSPRSFFRCTIIIVREGQRLGKLWIYGARIANISLRDRDQLHVGLASLGETLGGAKPAPGGKAALLNDCAA